MARPDIMADTSRSAMYSRGIILGLAIISIGAAIMAILSARPLTLVTFKTVNENAAFIVGKRGPKRREFEDFIKRVSEQIRSLSTNPPDNSIKQG